MSWPDRVGAVLDRQPADPMTAYFSVNAILATCAARWMAAAIIVLGISPFTAPFSTFDGAEIAAEQILHSCDAPLKVVQDATDFTCLTSCATPLAFVSAFDPLMRPDITDVFPVKVLVLRI